MLSSAFALGVLALIAGCHWAPANPNVRANAPLTLAPLDLTKYMGRWYIIGEIPYFAERGFVGSYSEWTLREDGKINDAFMGHKRSFEAPYTRHEFTDTVVPNTGNAHWKVELFWPVRVSQLTVYVDANYQVTLLAYPDKSLGWIMSRSPTMDEPTYQALLARFDAMGFDTARFQRVPQRAEDIGKPGYASAD